MLGLFINIYIYIYVCVYIYIYIDRERERGSEPYIETIKSSIIFVKPHKTHPVQPQWSLAENPTRQQQL